MNAHTRIMEREAPDSFEERLRGRGYVLTREPLAAELPSFFGSFQPDAIATGRDPKLLVEVITKQADSANEIKKIEEARSLVRDHPDWRLEVIYKVSEAAVPHVASLDAIQRRAEEVRRVVGFDPAASLIMAWSLLEAVARAAVPNEAARGLTPATVVELLTSLGLISQEMASVLREIGRTRNLIVHGDLDIEVDKQPLAVLDTVDRILKEIGAAQKTKD